MESTDEIALVLHNIVRRSGLQSAYVAMVCSADEITDCARVIDALAAERSGAFSRKLSIAVEAVANSKK